MLIQCQFRLRILYKCVSLSDMSVCHPCDTRGDIFGILLSHSMVKETPEPGRRLCIGLWENFITYIINVPLEAFAHHRAYISHGRGSGDNPKRAVPVVKKTDGRSHAERLAQQRRWLEGHVTHTAWQVWSIGALAAPRSEIWNICECLVFWNIEMLRKNDVLSDFCLRLLEKITTKKYNNNLITPYKLYRQNIEMTISPSAHPVSQMQGLLSYWFTNEFNPPPPPPP